MNDKLKILVVDDEDSLRISLASILELEGFDVKMAADGQEAINIASNEPFDIMFSDIRMPGITGNEVFKKIKQIKPDIIAVMMTAYALSDLIVDALNSGAFACISKPFEIETILSTIKDITTRPFAIVIDSEAKIDNKFILSLKNSGLNITSCDIDKISMVTNKPNIAIVTENNNPQETKDNLKKLKEIFPDIKKTIMISSSITDVSKDEYIKVGVTNFIDKQSVSEIFNILGKENRKLNIAMIDTDSEDYDSLKNNLKENGFNLISYSSYQALFNEINNSFFDAIIINTGIETNIADFQDKIQKAIPGMGVLYILNDDQNSQSLKEKGCFYINKPFEIDSILSLLNTILGK